MWWYLEEDADSDAYERDGGDMDSQEEDEGEDEDNEGMSDVTRDTEFKMEAYDESEDEVEKKIRELKWAWTQGRGQRLENFMSSIL